MANVFGNSAARTAVPFKAPEHNEDDYGPRLQLTVATIVDNKAVYVPNPELVGKTLILDVTGPASFTVTDEKGQQVEKTAIDTSKIVVVETGETFERQRLFQRGIVGALTPYAGQQVIAAVGTYESKKRKGSFVELIAPTADQQAAAEKLLDSPPF